MRVGWEIHKYTVLSINGPGLFTAEKVQMPDLCLYRLLACKPSCPIRFCVALSREGEDMAAQ